MKRRFFAALLCLCLLAATLPTATLAADPHDHTGWIELTAESIQTYVSADGKYALGDGNYYLGENVQGDFTVDGTVTLCLNGYTLTGTGTDSVIIVNSGTFTLTDCSEGETGKVTGGNARLSGGGVLVAYSDEAYDSGGVTFNLEGGNITGNQVGLSYSGYSVGSGGGVCVEPGNHFYMTGGNITDNIAGSGGNGVYLENHTTFTMSGGTIANNKDMGTNSAGGGVFFSSGTFTMTGGAITGNETGQRGGGIYLGSGTFTMSGGTISNNTTEYGDGGGVYMYDGTFTMTGGTITGNVSGSEAGGVCASDGTFSMTGGSIADNKASNIGGVEVSRGTFSMTGGSITGNTATGNYESSTMCGGVQVNFYGSIEMSGTPVIKDNTFSGGIRNLHFFNLQNNVKPYVTIKGPLNTGAYIGVTTNQYTAFTSGYNAQNVSDPSKYFFSDDSSLGVRLNSDGEAELVPGTYTIRYVQQDETQEIDYTLGQDITLEQPDGDGEMGWALNKGSLTAEYAGGATIPGGLGKTPGETITLYAVSQSSLATNVELRSNGGYIQWKYVDEGDDAWRNLAALSDLTGAAGQDGREVELQVADGYIQWRYEDGAWSNLLDLSTLQGNDGKDGVTPQLRINPDTNEWEVSYDNGKTWDSLGVSATGTDGQDGREVELRNNGTHIQWRYVGEDDNAWRDLAAISDLTGAAGQDGVDGREVELQVANGYIQWRYKDGSWSNLLDLSDLTGAAGQDGQDGEDGITPQLRINPDTNEWEVSYDNGATWASLGVNATGADGQDGQTPTIGANGNWWIGGIDTGIPATGIDGSDGQNGQDGLTPYIGSNGNWWIGTTDTGIKAAGTNGAAGQDGADGKNGMNGKNGVDGKDGQNGADGVGIANIEINENGELVVTLTDGTEKNLGNVQGADGVGISGVSINENGELIFTLTDGTELNAGVVRTAETAAAMGSTDISNLKTLVYVSVGIAGVSLAGMIGMLVYLFAKRKVPIGS